MSPDVALAKQVAANATVAALVADRIYPAGHVPQVPTLPLVTYQLLPSSPISITRDGKKDRRRVRIQVDIYGLTVLSIGAVEAAVEDALHGRTWSTTDADLAYAKQASGPGDLPADEDAAPAPGQKLHRRSVDYFVFYRKAA